MLSRHRRRERPGQRLAGSPRGAAARRGPWSFCMPRKARYPRSRLGRTIPNPNRRMILRR
ncbi:MAG: hypothetical protein M0C28_13700 [Candidatus Moduliflexus flocculans]|nr:hypothetical protein [Candidatus Moduliflexus flocculans]